MIEPERTVTDTVHEVRTVMTLFVTIGEEQLTRRFESSWTRQGEPTINSNRMHRDVEQVFRDLCKTWGIAEAQGLIVSENEERKTQKITEMTSSVEEYIRNTVSHDRAAEEAAIKGAF